MASIDTGAGSSGRRTTNHELPLIPFIDFMLCLVLFLLVTAVWNQAALLPADANVPSLDAPAPPTQAELERTLHVEMRGSHKFRLVWRRGSTVVDSIDVQRQRVPVGDDGDFSYPGLAEAIERQWLAYPGRHHAAGDPRLDRAVLHTDDSAQFADVTAAIDAIKKPRRPYAGGEVSAFRVTLAVN